MVYKVMKKVFIRSWRNPGYILTDQDIASIKSILHILKNQGILALVDEEAPKKTRKKEVKVSRKVYIEKAVEEEAKKSNDEVKILDATVKSSEKNVDKKVSVEEKPIKNAAEVTTMSKKSSKKKSKKGKK
jgi:hypothetical protein